MQEKQETEFDKGLQKGSLISKKLTKEEVSNTVNLMIDMLQDLRPHDYDFGVELGRLKSYFVLQPTAKSPFAWGKKALITRGKNECPWKKYGRYIKELDSVIFTDFFSLYSIPCPNKKDEDKIYYSPVSNTFVTEEEIKTAEGEKWDYRMPIESQIVSIVKEDLSEHTKSRIEDWDVTGNEFVTFGEVALSKKLFFNAISGLSHTQSVVYSTKKDRAVYFKDGTNMALVMPFLKK